MVLEKKEEGCRIPAICTRLSLGEKFLVGLTIRPSPMLPTEIDFTQWSWHEIACPTWWWCSMSLMMCWFTMIHLVYISWDEIKLKTMIGTKQLTIIKEWDMQQVWNTGSSTRGACQIPRDQNFPRWQSWWRDCINTIYSAFAD